ncbi:hypothetical protein HU200_027322 [Digitaria exilis]|uniref:Bifunctional inhibitor/plant lipid transfer protein/seed storage helical domain-containing protein n=1 Tax=Digitaria exilis TaxID=1010633 RepID=A0A835BXC8_9POAL|nr:hypothetical protein HU200_027322 [Digitaria exilis]
MALKVMLQGLVFSLAFAMFTTHHACGEGDCHVEKILVLRACRKTVIIGVEYEHPTNKCRRAVQKSDMVCICRTLSIEEEYFVSAAKLVLLARECGKPVPPGTPCGSK